MCSLRFTSSLKYGVWVNWHYLWYQCISFIHQQWTTVVFISVLSGETAVWLIECLRRPHTEDESVPVCDQCLGQHAGRWPHRRYERSLTSGFVRLTLAAVREILTHVSPAVIFGEDVAFGGVFRCTVGLRDKYGEFSCVLSARTRWQHS